MSRTIFDETNPAVHGKWCNQRFRSIPSVSKNTPEFSGFNETDINGECAPRFARAPQESSPAIHISNIRRRQLFSSSTCTRGSISILEKVDYRLIIPANHARATSMYLQRLLSWSERFVEETMRSRLGRYTDVKGSRM